MEKKPRKKFLPDEPRAESRKKGNSRFGNSRPAGKYGSKSFRPDEERSDFFEEPLSKKKSRGYGGSDNQRPREQPKPLYSTGKSKRYSRDEARPFREKKDFNPKFSGRKTQENEFKRGRSNDYGNEGDSKPPYRPGSQGGFSKEEPRPFIRNKDFNSKFPRKGKDGGEFGTNRKENQYRGDGEWQQPKKPYRSGRIEERSGDDRPRPFIRKKDFNPEFSGNKRDTREDRPGKSREFSRRADSKPFREGRRFESKFSGKKPFQKKGAKGKSKQENAPSLTEPFRLNKYLAHAGIASRREADELIKSGFVTVNGQVVLEMGHKVQPGDEVRFKNRVISPEKKVYILLNKPKDYITTASDERGRATVMDLVQNATELRIYPVGRLDRNTTGLLLLTNDGELAQKLTHPSFEAKKVYLASLDKPLKKEDMKQIADGVELEEGKAMVDAVEYADPRDKRKIGLEIHIGWNKVVRRIFEQLGYEVVQLDRVYYAGLTKDVPRGKWRTLTDKEVIMLKHFTN